MSKTVRYYGTLEEILEAENVQIDDWSEVEDFLEDNSYLPDMADWNSYFTGYVWAIIINRHADDYIAYTDYDWEDTLDDDFEPEFSVTGFCRNFMAIYMSTYERYAYLLSAYAAQESNLLDQITSTNTVKFNDTPQNGGDFDDDDHLSSITTTTASADVMPLIDRLDDISKKFRNLYKEWADEFDSLFMYQGVNDYEVA